MHVWFNGAALRIIVLVKSVPDTRIPLELVEEAGRVKEDWYVPILNPDDGFALAEALKIKKSDARARVTVIHLGSPSAERFIKDALALGCDEGLRIWDAGLEGLHTAAKMPVLARVA